MKNEHNMIAVRKTKQFQYAQKWISNNQIHHKLSN